MTMKEALYDLIDGWTEEEAATLLASLRPRDEPTESVPGAGFPHGRHGMDLAALTALVERHRHEPALMTDDEWQEFSEAIDAGRRPYRTIFS